MPTHDVANQIADDMLADPAYCFVERLLAGELDESDLHDIIVIAVTDPRNS